MVWFQGQRRLSKKLIAYTVIFSSLVTLLATSFQLYLDYSRDVSVIRSQMEQIRNSHLRSITTSLWAFDLEQLQVQIDDMANLPDMEYLAVLTKGTPIVSAGRKRGADIITQTFALEYIYKDKKIPLGTLQAVATLEHVYNRLRDRVIVILGAQAIKTFLVSAFIFLLFQYLVTRHLERMSDYTRGLALKSLDKPLHLERLFANPDNPDELDHVVNALNEMRENLRKSCDDLEDEHARRLDAERLAAVGEVSASIAHEIRNPLASIINGLGVLDRKNVSASDRAEVISLIDTETQRLQRILNDFLQFSKQSTPKLRDNDLSAFVEQMLETMKIGLDSSKNISFELKKSETPLRAIFDPEQLQQVLWNLLLNAVQAMPRGGEVTVSLGQKNGKVHIKITDEGEGVILGMHEKIIEPFFSGRPGGTGLGLSIAHRIVVDHGSRLKIESGAWRHGTSVSFSLDRAVV